MSALIETRDLWHVYSDGTVSLRGVNFKAMRGEVTVLLGPNGAGKTTLLLHLNGLLKPTRGEVLFEGKPVSYDKRNLTELRRRVGFIFQNADDQIVAPTVWQEVAFGPKNLGLSDAEVAERVREALNWVGLEGFEERLCNMLSIGERQKLAIAGVLAMHPDVILMDEPTASLDNFGLNSVLNVVRRLKAEGKTLIISTHDIDFAFRVADKFVVLHNGKIVHNGSHLPLETARKFGLRMFDSLWKR